MKTSLAKVNPPVARLFLLALFALAVGGVALGLSTFLIFAALIIPTWVLLGAWIVAPIEQNPDSWLAAWIKGLVIFVFVVVLGVFVPSYLIKLHSVAKLDVKLQDLVGTGSFAVVLVASLWALYRSREAGRI